MPELTVILCTRNPDRGRLARTLAGLAAQDLPTPEWEVLLVDNGSSPPLDPDTLPATRPASLRILRETEPGLTPARLRGIAEARGDVHVFVDDDNVLAPAFLRSALAAFRAHPQLGAAGGPVQPEFERPPPSWCVPFFPLLALRNCGPKALSAAGRAGAPWPDFAPVGAGLCVRRTAALAYAAAVRHDPARARLDRRAGILSSGGDNDLVFCTLHGGGDIAYLPDLLLTHLIPAARLEADYLARLNRGIQRSWVSVLALHGQCPWPAVPRWTVPLRAARAWFRTRAWSGPAGRVEFAGLLGRFEGQADLG